MPLTRRLLFVGLVIVATAVHAEVVLAPLFTDHAVLQRDKPVPIWGRADASEKITVVFAGQTHTTTAAKDGRWIVMLDALAAQVAGADLVVTGKNTVTISDVLVGEVWLCSGQSNMEFTVDARAGTWQANARVDRAAIEIASARFPLIRHVRIAHTVAATPAEAVKTSGWELTTPETVGGFTAVGYFFARDLFQKLGVPIGVINSSVGGTPVESWLSPAALTSAPALAGVSERWTKNLAEYPAKKAQYEADRAAWLAAEATAKAAPATAPLGKTKIKTPPLSPHAAFLKANPRPRAPRGPGDTWTPTGLFNGMINPLLPYALRGALWYQGESNTERPREYRALFSAMITAWRGHFGQGDFPFYFVQLANFKATYEPTPQQWPLLREAQSDILDLPQTGQAVTIDIGNPDDIHPTNKQDVGRRLALLARNRIYGITGNDTGPSFAGLTREGSALRVKFTHASDGLVAHDQPAQSLEIAGADRVFHPAKARIVRDTLLVSAPEVPEPVAVRYAWTNSPLANLFNGSGLPAAPFRSDRW